MDVVTPAGGDNRATARTWPDVLDSLLLGHDLTADDTA
ncbi:anthranilate phosphoribosyltransferase, partial [Streptomyces sp. 2MCAF27]